MDLFWQLLVFLVLGVSKLSRVLQLVSQESRIERNYWLPQPTCYAFVVAQDTPGFLNCKCTLLAHTQFFIPQQPQVLSWGALCLHVAWLVFAFEILLALGLIELHEVHTGSPLKPVRVPLVGSPSLQHVSCTPRLCVVGSVAEGALTHCPCHCQRCYIAPVPEQIPEERYLPLIST